MTTSPRPEDAQFDAYLDGALSDEARKEFARTMEKDDALRNHEALQGSIDAALERVFSPPSAQCVVDVIRGATPGSKRTAVADRPSILRRRWAVAAILALGLLGGYRIVSFLIPDQEEYPRREWQSLENWFAEAVSKNLKPDWVCRDEEEFRLTISRRLGQPLALAKLPDGITVGGLAYANAISERTLMILGRVHGDPAIVFVDRTAHDSHQALSSDSDLHMFRRHLGDLVLYEVSRLDRPILLDFVTIP
jgi:hypothetical protein